MTRRIARLLAERSHAVIDWRDLEQESELHALMGRKSVTGPMQDYIRREARQQLGHTRITPRITQNLRPSATGFHNPENAITARIDVTRLLARLTPGQSRVLILYDLYGYTQTEIAGILGISRVAVGNRRWTALQKLRGRGRGWGRGHVA